MTEPSNRRDANRSEHIIAALELARERGRSVTISAGGSKRHLLGRVCAYDELDVSGHRGIIDYQPQELIITARAGTPLAEINASLHANQQMLSFEPPLFNGAATLGGTLACNLSGPARPWGGSVRDAVLGVQLINGKAERLNFGGKVMKNVAGFDVSRLQAGALGTLGVLCEISLKVLPQPETSMTLCYTMSAAEAVQYMNLRAAEPRPLWGAFWLDGQLFLRLSGADSAVKSTATQWGGDILDKNEALWTGLREMTLPFFAGEAPLWRCSVKSTATVDYALGPTLIDWGGAQRWFRGEHSCTSLQLSAEGAGKHFNLYRGGDRSTEVAAPLSPIAQRLHLRLKHAFDPDGILNPGRLYSWL